MLGRHIVSYLPSQLLLAITALVALTVYTHLLSPEGYGFYTLIINGHMLFNVACYGWLNLVVLRMGPQAARDGTDAQLRTTTYTLFGALGIVLLLGMLIFQLLYPHSKIGWIVWFAFGLGMARSLLNFFEAWHRGALHIQRYNVLECGQAIISYSIGFALVYFTPLGTVGAVTGMLIGLSSMVWVDRGELLRLRRADFSLPMLHAVLRIGTPLIISNVLVFILTSSDRFLVEYFVGASAVGIYAAGYALVDRITQVLFMAIAMASYSLTVHRFEHEGIAAARAQTYRNGIGILALTMPACAGLILCAPQLAASVIGPEFRDGAIQIMPWITIATFCSGLATHYFDHAFLLAKKTHLLLFTQGPSAALNVALNLLLIPRYGLMGAAYAALAAYGLLLVLSITLGRRAFAIHFPWKPALQIAGATGIMSLALTIITFPVNLFGLGGMAILGAGVYSISLLVLNVEGARSGALTILRFAKNRLA